MLASAVALSFMYNATATRIHMSCGVSITQPLALHRYDRSSVRSAKYVCVSSRS